jgi:RHS repeat-associated protein
VPRRYTDAESGFQYLRARYYDPAAAQWLSRDPIAALTQSPYGYVQDDPLNLTDPSGLAPWDGWCTTTRSGTTTVRVCGSNTRARMAH